MAGLAHIGCNKVPAALARSGRVIAVMARVTCAGSFRVVKTRGRPGRFNVAGLAGIRCRKVSAPLSACRWVLVVVA